MGSGVTSGSPSGRPRLGLLREPPEEQGHFRPGDPPAELVASPHVAKLDDQERTVDQWSNSRALTPSATAAVMSTCDRLTLPHVQLSRRGPQATQLTERIVRGEFDLEADLLVVLRGILSCAGSRRYGPAWGRRQES